MKSDSTVANGSTFVVTDREGRFTRPYDGFYHRDTRLLDEYECTTNVRTLEMLEMFSPRPGERVVHLGSPLGKGARNLHVVRRQLVADGFFERLTFQNLSREPLVERVHLSVDAAFDDIFEVRGFAGLEAERTVETTAMDDGVRFRYAPEDVDFEREITVRTDTVVDLTFDDDGGASLVLELDLDPQEKYAVTVACEPDRPSDSVARAFANAREAIARREMHWNDEVDAPAVDDPGYQAVIGRSVDDLLSLTTETDHGPVLVAGTPWFATPFGRDSLIAAYQTLPVTTKPAVGTLRYLAAHQATDVDEFRDAQPGKIFHEIRQGELAARGRVPHTPYYGTVDATALFVVLAHETWRRTGDDALAEDLLDNVDAALDWLESYGDADGDGFIDYPASAGQGAGLTHQAWKDSDDGIMHPEGTHPDGPLAVAEVQGYYYDALVRSADLYRSVAGDDDRAAELTARAEEFARSFDEAFWLPDEEFYAIALDGNGDPIPTVSTNPGHCLWSGIVPEDRADTVIDRFVADDMFSGWGIRTVSADHPVYNPQSYHLGSVWPHDNSLIVLGMLNYDRSDAARTVATGLFDAAVERGNDRLPELFAGFDRSETTVPVQYGVACEPQAWAAGTPLVCARALASDRPDEPIRSATNVGGR